MKTNSITYVLTLAIVFFFTTVPTASFCANKGNSITNGGTEIYTPHQKTQLPINGPLVYGCCPGHPFLYRIPCQGL